MVTFPNPNHRGVTATISLKADSNDYQALKEHSQLAGIGQSNMLHLLLEIARLRVAAAQSKPELLVDEFGSHLEAYIWLTALDTELVNQEEFNAAAWAAKNLSVGKTFKERQEALFGLLQRRFTEQYLGLDANEFACLFGGIPFEAVDDDHDKRLRAEIEAKKPKS